jgi:hypothetical protein
MLIFRATESTVSDFPTLAEPEHSPEQEGHTTVKTLIRTTLRFVADALGRTAYRLADLSDTVY